MDTPRTHLARRRPGLPFLLLASLLLSAMLGCGAPPQRPISAAADSSENDHAASRSPASALPSSAEGTLARAPSAGPPSRPAAAPPGDSLPAPVAAMRMRLVKASYAGYDSLAALAGEDFVYTFGPPPAGGAASYWRTADAAGQDTSSAAALLRRLLRTPPAREGDRYTWPYWARTPPDSLSPRDWAAAQRVLGPSLRPAVIRERYWTGGAYAGPRTAIRLDGAWDYFVSGD